MRPTYSDKKGVRGVCTFSSRTMPKGTGQLQTFLKNATSLRENVHQVGSILFETNSIVTQLAIRLTSTFRPSARHAI